MGETTREQESAIRVQIAELEAELFAREPSERLLAELRPIAASCPVSLNEIADLITAPAARILFDGNYWNRRGIRGYYVQIKCGNQWCKVSVSHAEHGLHRIMVEELDEIDAVTLEPTIRIPLSQISVAFRSRAAEQALVHDYMNSSGIKGIWAEFYRDGHWYMVSVSHIDVPAHLSTADLERIAGQLLRQQTPRHRRNAE